MCTGVYMLKKVYIPSHMHVYQIRAFTFASFVMDDPTVRGASSQPTCTPVLRGPHNYSRCGMSCQLVCLQSSNYSRS